MVEGIGFGTRSLLKQIIKDNWETEPEDKKYSFQEVLFLLQEINDEEGKKYLERETTRSKHAMKQFVDYMLYRNAANFDSMVLITAEKGTGKSSAAIMMARYWCRLIGRKFNPARHIAYNNADVMNKIDTLDRFEPLICDEAIRFASSEDWNKSENKELKKKLGQVRTKHLFYMLCFPLKIYKLEKTYLESYVNYWIDLYDRGVGAVYVKDRNPTQDSWRVKEFAKIGSYTEFTSASAVQQKLKKHPNFWTILRFPKPPKKVYDNYLKVREKNVYDDDNVMKSVSKEDIHRALLVLALRDVMMTDTAVNMNRIILHLKNTYDISLTKGMVQTIIDDSKQLVTKIREEMATKFN